MLFVHGIHSLKHIDTFKKFLLLFSFTFKMPQISTTFDLIKARNQALKQSVIHQVAMLEQAKDVLMHREAASYDECNRRGKEVANSEL